MAKARKKKTRTAAKRPAKKKVSTTKLKGRKAPRRARAKSRKQESFVDALSEAAQLRRRLAGHNTFED